MRAQKLLKNLSYVCLYTSDLPESVRFYRDVLGLEPMNTQENLEMSNYYAFNTGETVLAIERHGVKKQEMKTKAENPVLFQFKIESPEQLEELNQHLEEQGAQLLDRSKQTSYGLITNFCDPDGNKLEVICQKEESV